MGEKFTSGVWSHTPLVTQSLFSCLGLVNFSFGRRDFPDEQFTRRVLRNNLISQKFKLIWERETSHRDQIFVSVIRFCGKKWLLHTMGLRLDTGTSTFGLCRPAVWILGQVPKIFPQSWLLRGTCPRSIVSLSIVMKTMMIQNNQCKKMITVKLLTRITEHLTQRILERKL